LKYLKASFYSNEAFLILHMTKKFDRLNIEMPIIRFRTPTSLVEVTSKSPKRHRAAVEKIARYFQREFGFDFLQYCSEKDDSTSYLFIDRDGWRITKNDYWDLPTLGAICFRKQVYEGFPKPIWRLEWVWLNPFKRDKEILKKYFDKFIKEFGYFTFTTPLSKSMEKFLIKNKYPTTLNEILEKHKRVS
jgi:hypothetical protein